MSRSPSSSPVVDVEYDHAPAPVSTRTVAIIKNHALCHRFDIEPRILEANFEVRKLILIFGPKRDTYTLPQVDCERKADGVRYRDGSRNSI